MARNYYIAEPYPDELIGSVLIRTAGHRGASASGAFAIHAGWPQSPPSLLFSTQLHEIGASTRVSALDLLHHHTPFRFITAFMSPAETQRLETAFLKGEVASTSSLSHSAMTGARKPRFCDQCLSDDLRQYGEGYWHLRHNLPFVDRCPIHDTPLRQITIAPSHRSFTASKPPEAYEAPTVSGLIESAPTARWLAEQSLALLGSRKRKKLSEWSAEYREAAERKGFPRATTGLCGKSFCTSFSSFYKGERLSQLGCSTNLDGRSWPSLLLRKGNTAEIAPGKHLLVQGFLMLAPTPTKAATPQPGPKIRDYKELDDQLSARLKRRMASAPVQGRPSARELLIELDAWGLYRHKRGTLLKTRALVDSWYRTYRKRLQLHA